MNELEEFYSYVEMPQAAENLKAWNGSFHGGVGLSVSLSDFSSELVCGKNGPRVRHQSAELTWNFFSRA